MTHGGQEPAPADPGAQHSSGVGPPGEQPPPGQVPFQPVLAASNPKSGRQLAMIMGAMTLFFVVMVVLATWAASRG